VNREPLNPIFSWIKEHPLYSSIIISLAIHVAGLGSARLRQSKIAVVSAPSLYVEVFEVPAPEEETQEEALLPPSIETPPGEEVLPPPRAAVEPPPPPPPPEEAPRPAPEMESVVVAPQPIDADLPPPSREAVLQAYAYCLAEEIERTVNFPPLASKMDLEGSVVVSFTLQRDGTLKEYYIPERGKSFFPPFNQEALRAVRSASFTFSSFPEGIEDESLTFRLPVSFIPSHRAGAVR
jgi:protein TonB